MSCANPSSIGDAALLLLRAGDRARVPVSALTSADLPWSMCPAVPSDDRQQLIDNFFLNERFTGEESAGRSSIGPGLMYRFHYGADIEFVCIDTSRQSMLFGDRFFEHKNHASFLDASFPEVGGSRAALANPILASSAFLRRPATL